MRVAVPNQAFTKSCSEEPQRGTSPVAQWLRLRSPSAEAVGSIPGQGTRSHMHAATKSSRATAKTWCNLNK